MILSTLLLACGGSPNDSSPATQAAKEPALTEADAPHTDLDFADPEACASCHAEVLSEWRQSMHARAHADHDPVFAGMRALRIAKQGEAVGKKGAPCHNPLAPDDPDSPAGKVGVGCGTCHQGPDAALTAPDDRTLCLRCHDATQNPKGAATCTTGPENEHAGAVACTTCHMRPEADGRRTHRFDGPHRAWYQDDPSFLTEAVGWTATREGDVLTGQLTNRTGHGFPSGFPGRIAVIQLSSGDWSAQAAVLKKVYVDDAGQPTMPPFAARLAEDTRLEPGETRTVRVELPAGTGPVDAHLIYHLIPPPAAKPLKLEGAQEAQPVKVKLN